MTTLRRERERAWQGSLADDVNACVGIARSLVREWLDAEEREALEEAERAAEAEAARPDFDPKGEGPANERLHSLQNEYMRHRVPIKVIEKTLWARGLHMAQINARHQAASGKRRRVDPPR